MGTEIRWRQGREREQSEQNRILLPIFSLSQPPLWASSLFTFYSVHVSFLAVPTDWGDLPHAAGGPNQGAAGSDARRQEEAGG